MFPSLKDHVVKRHRWHRRRFQAQCKWHHAKAGAGGFSIRATPWPTHNICSSRPSLSVPSSYSSSISFPISVPFLSLCFTFLLTCSPAPSAFPGARGVGLSARGGDVRLLSITFEPPATLARMAEPGDLEEDLFADL